MGFLFDGLFVLLLLALILGALSYRGSEFRLRCRQNAAARTHREKERLDKFEQGRHAAVPLVCMNCTPPYEFDGPLPDTGCPRCHDTALVITAAELNYRTKG
jgi:hypothetical protein